MCAKLYTARRFQLACAHSAHPRTLYRVRAHHARARFFVILLRSITYSKLFIVLDLYFTNVKYPLS